VDSSSLFPTKDFTPSSLRLLPSEVRKRSAQRFASVLLLPFLSLRALAEECCETSFFLSLKRGPFLWHMGHFCHRRDWLSLPVPFFAFSAPFSYAVICLRLGRFNNAALRADFSDHDGKAPACLDDALSLSLTLFSVSCR